MINKNIREIQFASVDYDKEVQLRYAVLRKPLNLNFTAEQLEAESAFFHLGYFEHEKIIACLILAPEKNGKMKMKQVAVDFEFQGKGIGAALVKAAESFALEKGFKTMYCHARDTAVPFYLKLGYHQIGEMFEEVTIPHFEMEKAIL
jgi:predicted GNAT family N-acyltransferase